MRWGICFWLLFLLPTKTSQIAKGPDLVAPSVSSPGARETLPFGRWGLPWTDKGVTATLGEGASLHNAGVLVSVSGRVPVSPGTVWSPGSSSTGCQDVAGGMGGESTRTLET